jgi:trk system potassium uptake protein
MNQLRPLAFATARGAILAAAPGPLALIGWWRHATIAEAGVEAIVPASVASLALVLAAWQLPSHPRLATSLVALSLASMLGVAMPALLESPALALMLALVIVTALAALVRLIDPAPERRRHVVPNAQRLAAQAARGAAASALVLWLLSTLAGALRADDPFGLLALGASLGVAVTLTLLWTRRASLQYRHIALKLFIIALTLIALGVLIVLVWRDWSRLLTLAAAFSILALALVPKAQQAGAAGEWWEPIFGHPERLFVATFAVLCTIGTLLLAMPESSASGVGLALDDAAFTAVSAVCVTGLTVVDTGGDFSPTGQVFILMLIQAGGLGIMTFSTAAIRMLGRRMSLRHEGVVARLVSREDRSQVFSITGRIVKFTFVVEAIGTLALWLAFMAEGGEAATSLWRALFTAISAFCNAGFALDSDSLVFAQASPVILHIVALLIILGGLAPAVVLALPRFFRAPRAASPQLQLVLAVSASLLIVGFGAFLALEWSRSLAGLSVADKLHNAWFQSVTLRTAGFNSVDLTQAQPATIFVMLLMMFIGGSPGGTAGGIKTTTAGLLILTTSSILRGKRELVLRGRQIRHRSLQKAVAVTIAALGTAFASLVAIALTQDMPTGTAVFEVVSATGTVGLSLGGTAALDEIGKGIIMVTMFLGRVGPLTLLMFLSQSGGGAREWKRPEVDVDMT